MPKPDLPSDERGSSKEAAAESARDKPPTKTAIRSTEKATPKISVAKALYFCCIQPKGCRLDKRTGKTVLR